jgi:hypothetical protein
MLGHTPDKQRTDVLQFLTGLELLSGDDEEGGQIDTGVLVRLNLEPFSVPAAQDSNMIIKGFVPSVVNVIRKF